MEKGTTVQRQLSDYLQYELYHVLGAYGIAEKSHGDLALALKEMASQMVEPTQSSGKESNPRASPPPDKLAIVADLASRHNWQLSYYRHGRPQTRSSSEATSDSAPNANPAWPYREPFPEDLPLTKIKRFQLGDRRGVTEDRENPWLDSEIWQRVPKFYSEAIHGLQTWKPKPESKKEKRNREHVLADSIIAQLDHVASAPANDADLVKRRLLRYQHRRQCAHEVLARQTPCHSNDSEPDRFKWLYQRDASFRAELYKHNLSTGGDSLPLFAISALAEAHLSMHAVEAWQQMCLGERAEEYTSEVTKWLDSELERCIELNTFAYCISRTAPWLFAADNLESEKVFADSSLAWEHARPARGMWIAGQIGLLALHRRAAARALKGDRDRGNRDLAYNDYHKLQRLIRDAERRVRIAPIQVDGALEFLAALGGQAHHRIGELYRVENAHRPARKHFNIANHRLDELSKSDKLSDVLCNSRCSVELLVSHGKACYEMGRHKEALCWHLRGWRSFLQLHAVDTETVTNTDAIETAIKWLERVRYEPEMLKSDLVEHVGPVIDQLERVTVSQRYVVLAGEILLRLGHLLLVINLKSQPRTAAGAAGDDSGCEALALTCLRRARECDGHSTMIVADLLKARSRLEKTRPELLSADTDAELDELPSVGRQWPRGGSDFERLARASEYVTLRRQRTMSSRSGYRKAEPKVRIAHDLLLDFFMNTDSINVRKSQGYNLLMRGARPSLLPSESDAAIEFICMRRYSSFFPLLPRPSAFRSLCGGYFIRLHHDQVDPATAGSTQERTRKVPFGIAVDPGVDFVETLYRAGYSLSDIDMILVTHDHVDHAGAVDTLLSLLHVRFRTLSDERGGEKPPPVTLLMSKSMAARYAKAKGLRKKDRFAFRCIETLMARTGVPKDGEGTRALAGVPRFPDEFELIPISTKDVDHRGHLDLSGEPSFGICIRARSRKSGGVAITSDTPAPPARSVDDDLAYDEWRKAWAPALEADVLVAHLSSVPLTELRKLSDKVAGDSPLPDENEEQAKLRENVEHEEAILKHISIELQNNKTVGTGLIEYGLWLRSRKPGETAPIVGTVPESWQPPSGQAFLTGILRWAEAFKEAHKGRRNCGLFIVGELSEELGTMRSKIATSINEMVLAKPHTYSLTGDIGLSVLVTSERGKPRKAEVRVLCVTCTLDTDRVLEEQYHAPDHIEETCVKGENEGIFYNCVEHSPKKDRDSVFLEQLERFDIFGR